MLCASAKPAALNDGHRFGRQHVGVLRGAERRLVTALPEAVRAGIVAMVKASLLEA
jgi:hypothetical protein